MPVTVTQPSEKGCAMKIMLIDDDRELLESVRDELISCGYEIREFCDPRQAITSYNSSDYSLVITDLVMPQMTGLDVMQSIREIDPRARVIVMSGHPSEYLERRILKEGADAFFHKPMDLPRLILAIQRIEASVAAPQGSDGNPVEPQSSFNASSGRTQVAASKERREPTA